MAFKCWMVIVQISWGYARELWGLKAPMDLFIGWGMNPGCTWGQNSGVPVKHMVHYGPCLVTGYRRLFLFFFFLLFLSAFIFHIKQWPCYPWTEFSDLISCSLPTIYCRALSLLATSFLFFLLLLLLPSPSSQPPSSWPLRSVDFQSGTSLKAQSPTPQ